MTLTPEQYDQLLSNYVNDVVDGMDLKSLVQFATEQIEQNCREMFSMDEELIEEIGRFYDKEDLTSMLEEVGANPEDFDLDNSSEDELTDDDIQFLKNNVKKHNN